ncbi:MAG: oligosaccharide flippase family protein [Elusimicrobia bacterium]|nr:oligosaccharide flippase family protein [Elusimicrobiota bacterium]
MDSPPPQSKSARFVRNIGWNILGQAGIAGLGLLAVPYLVHRLGTEVYGLYIIMNTVGTYLTLLAFGSGGGAMKYVAEFCAARNRRGLRDTLRYTAAIHVLGALGGAGALALGARFCAVRIFHVPAPLISTAVLVLYCAAGAAAFAALIQYATSVLQGLQRFDWQNLVSFLQNGLMLLGAVAALALGLGLPGVAGWYVALSVGLSLFALLLLRRLLPERWDFHDGAGLSLDKYAVFSLSLWLGGLASIVTFQVDKIFLARGVSLSGLTLYAVPAGLLQRLAVLPAIISTVLMPMVSEVHGPDVKDALERMYLKSVRFLLWAILPAYVLLFALIPQFLGLWLGGDFAGLSVWPARLLVLAQAFCVLNYIPHAIVSGRGRPWYLAGLSWAQAILSVIAWKLLIPHYHLLGAALGSLIAQVLPSCVYLVVVHRRILGISFGRYFAEGLRGPLISAGLLFAAVFPLHAQATGWIRLILLGAGGIIVFYASAWALLDAEGRQFVLHYLRREPRAAG